VFAKRMGARTVEVSSSHLAMVSEPNSVVELIEKTVATLDERTTTAGAR